MLKHNGFHFKDKSLDIDIMVYLVRKLKNFIAPQPSQKTLLKLASKAPKWKEKRL